MNCCSVIKLSQFKIPVIKTKKIETKKKEKDSNSTNGKKTVVSYMY